MNYGISTLQRGATLVRRKQQEARLIRAEVVLGSPMAHCRGTGICRVTAAQRVWKETQPDCKRVRAIIGYESGVGLYFSFIRKSMCINMVHRHFGGEEGFRVEADFEVPAFIRLAFPGSPAVIVAGVYPTLATMSRLVVMFR
jgi:hypothetical protein